ncbi:hypothetical protein ACIQPR_09930 [Streptomyces sp. NPDC091280]
MRTDAYVSVTEPSTGTAFAPALLPQGTADGLCMRQGASAVASMR